MGEARRDQLDVGPRAGERRAQRAVVRRRVGRRIDDLDPHPRALSPCGSPTASSTPAGERTFSPASTRSAPPIPRKWRARCWCSTTPPTTARPRRCGPGSRGAGAFGERVRLIERDRRAGKAENDSLLLREARGRAVPAPERGLRAAPGRGRGAGRAPSTANPEAAAAGAQLSRPTATSWPAPGACPGLGTLARAGALPPPRAGDPERGRRAQREVGLGPVVGDAGPPRRRRRGRLPRPALLRLLRRDRLLEAPARRRAGPILFVPAAEAVHHEQLATDRSAGSPPRHRVPPRPRHLHAKAPRPRRGRDRAGPVGLELRAPRAGRARPPGPLRRLVLASRPPRPPPLAAARASPRPRRPTTAASRADLVVDFSRSPRGTATSSA